jgi:hypothetical protein
MTTPLSDSLPLLLTVKMVARPLSVSLHQVWRITARGDLKPFEGMARPAMVTREILVEHLER